MIEPKSGIILKMKLVCFSNNTAGGLLCDLLNHKRSKLDGYKVASYNHGCFKVGDSQTIQTSVDVGKWRSRVIRFAHSDEWFGTHLHPTAIPDITLFDKVVAITTCTRESKLYRWLRYYNGWFKNTYPNWVETDELDQIDQIRILAKKVFPTFDPVDGCINVEFSDIVSGNFIRSQSLDLDFFAAWQERNYWMYDSTKSWAEKRFDEAEWEIVNCKPFVYI